MNCPLCQSDNIIFFHSDRSQKYSECQNCELIFVHKDNLLSFSDEKERYALHNNTVSNDNYVKYLQDIYEKILLHSTQDSKILDFGSGENSVLEHIFKQNQINIDSYDPMYNIGQDIKKNRYDIIILCEVIEHFSDPQKELMFIKSHLKPNGKLLIKTSIYNNKINFSNWWYKGDRTHITFYSEKTVSVIRELIFPFKIILI